MSSDGSNEPGTTNSQLPRPRIELVTSKAARPAAGGELDAIVTVSVDFPPVAVDRKPLNLALVIDRSGSMNGPALEAAKAAAQTAIGMLLPGDWVTVVTFDSVVDSLVPLTKVSQDRRAVLDAITGVRAGGSTDLYGGWAEGLSQLLSCAEADVVSRIVILSDGRTNHGVTDLGTIVADVSQAVTHGVTTTTMGLAAHYDEHLLRAVADAGNGNYVFLEGPDQVIEAFEHELAGLGALRGRNVTLHASGQGFGLRYNAADLSRNAAAGSDGSTLRLPDLIAGLPIEIGAVLTFEKGADPTAITLSWDDAITGQRDEESLTLAVPAVEAAEFAALPLDQRVLEHTLALRIAAAKLQLGDTARRGNLARARDELVRLQQLVEQLPQGEALTQERQELSELERRIEQGDYAVAARTSEKFARGRFYNRSDEKLRVMSAFEADIRREKMAAIAAAGLSRSRPGSSAGTVLFSERYHRQGGKPVTLELVLGDITDQAVDAIVNSSNRGLFGSQGVDGAIHRRAGPALTAATQAIGNINYGEAVFTSGYDLPAQYVIHVATPAWGTTGRELQLLAQAYESAFSLADRLGATSLAFPAIGTGTYQYPMPEALRAAADAVTPWLTTKGNFELVRFVVLDPGIARDYLNEMKARGGHQGPANYGIGR